MNDYQQSFIVNANPASVYAALTTTKGLRGWWTQTCDVAGVVGGAVKVQFGGTHKEMRIEKLELNREVRWLCTAAHIDLDSLKRKDEWVGTHIVFRLTQEGEGKTRVDFEHIGLTPSFECYEICNNGWRFFLNSLQTYSETGTGSPYQAGDNCDHTPELRSA